MYPLFTTAVISSGQMILRCSAFSAGMAKVNFFKADYSQPKPYL
jgi:hypothetical protein